MSGESTQDTGAATARAVITVTAQDVPPERQADVTAHIEGWLTRWLSSGVRLADSETGIDYALTATAEHASYQAGEHGGAASELRDRLFDAITDHACTHTLRPGEDPNDPCPLCLAALDAVTAVVESEVERFRKLAADYEQYEADVLDVLRRKNEALERAEAAIEQASTVLARWERTPWDYQSVNDLIADARAALGQPPAEKETKEAADG